MASSHLRTKFRGFFGEANQEGNAGGQNNNQELAQDGMHPPTSGRHPKQGTNGDCDPTR
jgi:hypothetical protein